MVFRCIKDGQKTEDQLLREKMRENIKDELRGRKRKLDDNL